jgi:hypothetical protein
LAFFSSCSAAIKYDTVFLKLDEKLRRQSFWLQIHVWFYIKHHLFCADFYKLGDSVCNWCKDVQYKMLSKWVQWFLNYQMTPKKKFIFNYWLKSSRGHGKNFSLKDFYPLIKVWSPWVVHRNTSRFQTTAFVIHPERIAINWLVYFKISSHSSWTGILKRR